MGEKQDDEQDNPGAATNTARPKYFSEDYFRTKKQTTAIRSYFYLIEVLRSEQPLAAAELAEALGMSKVTVLSGLKRLISLDLVCQIKFEHHVYYCINGKFRSLIDTLTPE